MTIETFTARMQKSQPLAGGWLLLDSSAISAKLGAGAPTQWGDWFRTLSASSLQCHCHMGSWSSGLPHRIPQGHASVKWKLDLQARPGTKG